MFIRIRVEIGDHAALREAGRVVYTSDMTTNHPAILHVLLVPFALALLAGCSSKAKQEDLKKITRHQASQMEQLAHVGNVWISEQPTEKDLIWMRDNAVSMVMDTRGREEDRGFDERAYVVSIGMQYHPIPLEIDQDFVIRYFDMTRDVLSSRQDVPTLIHGETADRAAAVWMVSRVLDDKVDYEVALAEAEIAGLNREVTLRLVQQYLMERGVSFDYSKGLAGSAPMQAEPGPDEIIYRPADGNQPDTSKEEAKSQSTDDSRLD